MHLIKLLSLITVLLVCIINAQCNYRHVELGLFPSVNFSSTSHPSQIPIENNGLLDGVTWNRVNSEFEKLTNEPVNGSEYKLILFLRHSEGWHNVAERKYGSKYWNDVESKKPQYLDSTLSDDGIVQAQQLQQRIIKDVTQNKLRIDLILCSPFSRALQTAEIGLVHLWSNHRIPKISVEEARESIGVHYCDKRHNRTYLMSKFPKVDFKRLISNEDTLWTPDVRESDQDEFIRGRKVLDWIYNRREKRVIVPAHGGIINAITASLGYAWGEGTSGKTLPGDIKYISGFSMRNTEILPVIVRRDLKK
ncbi:phosphoglycerate mutase [Acrasis kona]|uniref:Phosphoglycerate mutase n=1 Tax=Acrasis kona TaxID=1008807 RepID=A0AAW2ZMS5_9EUKA